ncbi:MAG: Hsp20/alpha crystallin family protein [Lachnospiraceae bacterium]|nr:Hsp20/alpha crystallin family protein [Lachnospiraceae bacterium]
MLFDNLFDDFFDDFAAPVVRTRRYYPQMNSAAVMRTDVKEVDGNYELAIDLPGYAKENVTAHLNDGYLTISAKEEKNNDEKDQNGKYLRRERYTGSVSRSFYVGENLTEEDIHAKFENGILKITLPKDAPKKVEEKKYIAIEG